MRIKGVEIIQLHALRNSHNGDICHLIHRACAQNLNAQEYFLVDVSAVIFTTKEEAPG